jgi:predicted metal-dependent hydrolase
MTKEFIDGQLPLAFNHTGDSLRCSIEKCLGRAVSLVLTENSTSMLSARLRDGIMHVRLHRMFLNADNHVIGEIIVFLKNRKGDMSHFRSFVRNNKEQLNKRPPKKVSVNTRGKFYDLRELFNELNEEYFGGVIKAAITWGAKSSRCAVRKRTLGSYCGRSDLIRINPVLDKKSVPRYFIAFVVYHEMLHAAIGISRQGGRRRLHTREFKKKEMLFGEYERAIAWEGRASA